MVKAAGACCESGIGYQCVIMKFLALVIAFRRVGLVVIYPTHELSQMIKSTLHGEPLSISINCVESIK